MKKTFLTLTLITSSILFAKNNILIKNDKKISITCCTQSASSGTPGTSSWVKVTVMKCVQGTPSTAGHQACAFAQSAANSQLNNIQQNMSHALTIE